MGIIKFFAFKIIPVIGLGLFVSMRLGNQLPVATRNTGRAFGMIFHYVKTLIKNLKPPTDEPGEVVKIFRSITQQSHAFTREFSQNLMTNRKEMSEVIPSLKIDPYEKFRMKNEEPIKIDETKKEKITGVDLIENSILERRRIMKKRLKDKTMEDGFYKL